MKHFWLSIISLFFSGVLFAAPLPDNLFFRAMQDEMQRSLKQLRLKDHPNPHYIAYFLRHFHTVEIRANMGALAPAVYNPQNAGELLAEVFVSVGNDKQDNLGFADIEEDGWNANVDLPYSWPIIGYEALRQRLWKLTDRAYLKAADLYKKKQAYKQKKNIQQTLPDVIPAPMAHYQEEIPPFVFPDISRLQEEVRQISTLAKDLPFVESFEVKFTDKQQDVYFLNSRGAFAQYTYPERSLLVNAHFRQPDGKTAEVFKDFSLPDTSVSQMRIAQEKVKQFVTRIQQAYGASDGEAYAGPVLLKPLAAAKMLDRAVLSGMKQSKPFLRSYTEDDPTAGKLHKKRNVRVSSNLLALYDRPLERSFEGVALRLFSPVDAEGVAAENLTLVENGFVKDFPLTQRPLTKHHRSNGHARLTHVYGPREGLTNVFVEPTQSWTDEQMEEKLLERCRELGLEYGYILHDAYPDGELGIERIYTQDGRKETVLHLKWDGNFFTQRDLRNVLAVGGKRKLAFNDWRNTIVTPSILLQEAELVPQEHKPHQKPFVARPK